jgi:hypothetical protein
MSMNKTVPMCCVSLDYHDYLMPSKDGLKVVELMQSAILCEREYVSGTGLRFTRGEPPDVGYRAITPSQINSQPVKPATPGKTH